MPGPLHGVRVLDVTSVVMGPYATQMLGDLGGDVITVEPREGDANRGMGPRPHPELSGTALNLMRGKRSVCLDLKAPGGVDVLLRMAATVDVVVTNLRPGPLERLGFTYETVAAVRPDIVWCQGHGYPSDSPRAEEPAYDDVVQAASGYADVMGRTVGEPLLPPTILADKLCGLTMVAAVTAALFHRERTGEGQRIEVPMVETAVAFLLVEHAAGATTVPPLAPAGYRRVLSPDRRPHRTLDGWVSALPYTGRHWRDLFVEAGRHDLVDDPRLATAAARSDHVDDLYRWLGEVLATRTTSAWLETLARLGVPASPVVTLDELVSELPERDHPVAGRHRVIPPPVRFARTPAAAGGPAPLIGQHDDEVLVEIGLTVDEIVGLRAGGVLRPSP